MKHVRDLLESLSPFACQGTSGRLAVKAACRRRRGNPPYGGPRCLWPGRTIRVCIENLSLAGGWTALAARLGPEREREEAK